MSPASPAFYVTEGRYAVYPGSRGTCHAHSFIFYFVCLFGHNFGSEHDPDTEECAPADTTVAGGKYIMYSSPVSGQLPNNRVRCIKI